MDTRADSIPTTQVAVLGTGRMGSALALRFAAHGTTVAVGSRDPEQARSVADRLAKEADSSGVTGLGYVEAARSGSMVVLAVPYAVQSAVLDQVGIELAGKILVVANVALDPAAFAEVHLPPNSSAALEAQAQLGSSVPVVAAFQNMMYRSLLNLDQPVESDVFVAGDDPASCGQVMDLATSAGIRTWHIGPLVNSIAAEAMTSILIHLGIAHGSKVAGVRITGIDPRE